MQHSKESVGPRLVLFILMFVASVLAACTITRLTIGLNFAGISHVLLSLLCASPVAIGLFVFLNTRLKKRIVLRTLLPVLVFPLLFGLLFVYTMVYERNPQHMFQMFVADPIPTEVTDIRSRDISAGFEEDIVIVFRASPEVVDSIIAQKHLQKAARQSDGKFNFPSRYFPEFSWETDWVWYERTFYSENGSFTGYVMMWVDPVRSIVIYRTAG